MSKPLIAALVVVSAVSAIFAALIVQSLLLQTAGTPTPSTGSDVWTVLTAIGTVAATGVAVWLAARSLLDEKGAVARVVAAWVTDDYEPDAYTSSYLRRVVLRVANESNEPVYNAHLSVIVGPGVRLGPLNAPAPIAVIPPRRELAFDISLSLLAHGDTFNPRVEFTFTDPREKRWFRDVSGRLSDITGKSSTWGDMDREDPLVAAQIGLEGSLLNPMAVAIRFLYLLRLEGDDSSSGDIAKEVLAPEAIGWATVSWDGLREELADFQPTSMVDYPARYIARVKLAGDVELQGKQVEGNSGIVLTDTRWVTLTFAPDRGWRVWGVGHSVQPQHIRFPPGTFGTS